MNQYPRLIAVFVSGISHPDHVEDHAGLTFVAEALNRLSGLRVESKQERAGSDVDHTVGIARATVAENITFAASAPDQSRHIVRPQEMPVDGIDCVHASAGVRDVHDAVDNNRCGLIADSVNDAVLKQPPGSQRFHVGSIDLGRWKESRSRQIEIVEPPVQSSLGIRLLRGIGQCGSTDQDAGESIRESVVLVRERCSH